MYYLADPLAEMPPFILVDEKSKYEDVNAIVLVVCLAAVVDVLSVEVYRC